MDFKPLNDRVLVQRVKAEEKTTGGILLPPSAQEVANFGAVLAVGRGNRGPDGSFQVPEVKVGDNVMFGKYTGSDIKVNGEDCIVMREEDILGIMED